MNPFDYGQALADFWVAGGKAFVKAQNQAGQAMTDSLQAMTAGTPTDMSGTSADLAGANQAMMGLWTAASSLYASLAARLPTQDGSEAIDATLRNMMDPRRWMAGGSEMDEVLAKMAEGPRFADLWDIERRYARVMKAWMDVRRAGLEHNAVVLQGWVNAGHQFTEELARLNAADQAPPDSKATLALWTETANTQLLQTQRSEAFLHSQRATIRATTELKMAQQELVEHFGRQYGFPTRTELDDVHRTVTELRREVRALRRALSDAAEARPVVEPPPVPVRAVPRPSPRATAARRS